MNYTSLIIGLSVCALGGPPRSPAQQQPPVLRGEVHLLTIEVQVTGAKDAPMREFVTSDFEVTISGRQRPVVSVTLLHHDEGTVVRDLLRVANSQACFFGFHRKVDKVSAHYLVAVERSGADQIEVKQVRMKMADKAFAVQQWGWRSPIRKGA
jgi:hypothetical protein